MLSSVLDINEKTTETISERIPAESNISLQSSEDSSKAILKTTPKSPAQKEIDESQSFWVGTTVNLDHSSTKDIDLTSKSIPLAEPTKPIGFESITKLPSDITTPSDDTITNYDEKSEMFSAFTKTPTTDYEITTIRFSYVPTEKETENTVFEESTTDWYYAGSTHIKPTTTEEVPITTYRPKYYTTISEFEDTTSVPDTTPEIEVSSRILIKTTAKEPTTTELTTKEVEVMTTSESPTTTIVTDNPTTEVIKTTESTMGAETTSIVITVTTEISAENRPVMILTTTEPQIETQSTPQDNIDFNEVTTTETKQSTTQEATTMKPTTIQEATTMTPTTIEPTIEYFETVTEKVENTVENVETTTEKVETTTEIVKTVLTEADVDTTEYVEESTTESVFTSKTVHALEDLTSYGAEMTTEASSRVLDEAESGAAIAIAVSTIGVIALILLIGLLVRNVYFKNIILLQFFRKSV